MQLLLIPLDDTVLFPGMTATLAAEVGDEERVFVLPRDGDDTPRSARSPRWSTRPGSRAPARRPPWRAPPRSGGRRPPGADGTLRVEVQELHDGTPTDERTSELEREYRAVVEEILELRGDDGRDRRLPALDRRAGRARRHLRLLAPT